jgi:hypothetical protein
MRPSARRVHRCTLLLRTVVREFGAVQQFSKLALGDHRCSHRPLYCNSDLIERHRHALTPAANRRFLR